MFSLPLLILRFVYMTYAATKILKIAAENNSILLKIKNDDLFKYERNCSKFLTQVHNVYYIEDS